LIGKLDSNTAILALTETVVRCCKDFHRALSFKKDRAGQLLSSYHRKVTLTIRSIMASRRGMKTVRLLKEGIAMRQVDKK
jgi:hypothetical protein